MIKINPTIETQKNGSLFLCDIVDGTYFKRVYYDYTKREAVRLFKSFVRQELKNPSGNY